MARTYHWYLPNPIRESAVCTDVAGCASSVTSLGALEAHGHGIPRGVA